MLPVATAGCSGLCRGKITIDRRIEQLTVPSCGQCFDQFDDDDDHFFSRLLCVISSRLFERCHLRLAFSHKENINDDKPNDDNDDTDNDNDYDNDKDNDNDNDYDNDDDNDNDNDYDNDDREWEMQFQAICI